MFRYSTCSVDLVPEVCALHDVSPRDRWLCVFRLAGMANERERERGDGKT